MVRSLNSIQNQYLQKNEEHTKQQYTKCEQSTVYSLYRGDGATERDLAEAGHSGK